MTRQINTTSALKIWAAQPFLHKEHPDTKKLYQFSLPRGLEKASEYEIRHLSFCPRCLKTWKTLCDFNSLSKADDSQVHTDETIFSFGFLQAASSGFSEPVFLKSDCEKFMLGIFPQVDQPQTAMIVFETAEVKSNYSDMTARITDTNGRVLLDATIKQGRAAGKINRLNEIDLSTWSIVLSRPSDKEDHE